MLKIKSVIDIVEGNTKELSVVTIETTGEQNLKRIRRKQVPLPTKIFIRAKGEFKKYVKQFNSDMADVRRGKLGHKVLVIGHYRHFMNEKFINVKGTKKWIFPYWKGISLPSFSSPFSSPCWSLSFPVQVL